MGESMKRRRARKKQRRKNDTLKTFIKWKRARKK